MVELMVTIAVLGILATIAAPNFTSLIAGWRVRNAVENFQSTLHFARSEAIKRGGGVQIQPTSGADWSTGWQVIDTKTPGDPLQQVAVPPKTEVESGSINEIKFDRWGTTTPAIGLTFQSDRGLSARRLCMSSGGRIRIVPGSSCS